MADFVGADRPGHDEHPVHDLRPRRQRGRPPPARARADPAAGRLGRAQPGRDLGADRCGRHDRAAARPGCTAARPGRGRHHQPARDHRGVGPPHRPALLQRDRLAGHPHRPDRQPRWSATAAATRSGARPGCRRRRTSPAARSSGSSRTSTASARPPRRATRSSATPTPGCSGTSPAAPTAACTSPT